MAKKITKRKNQKKVNYAVNISGIILILIGIFGITQKISGPFGVLMANIARFFVGDIFFIFDLLLILSGSYLFIKGHFPKIKFKKIIGSLLVFIGIMQFLGAIIFPLNHINSDFLSITFNHIKDNFSHGSLKNSTFIGMLGALIYSGSYHFFSWIGTYLVSIIFLIWGSIILLDIPFQRIVNFCQDLGKFFYDLFDHTPIVNSSDKKVKSTFSKNTESDISPDPLANTLMQLPSKQNLSKSTSSIDNEEQNLEEIYSKTINSHYSNYQLPSIKQLSPTKSIKGGLTKEELRDKEEKIVDTFAEFKIAVQVTGASIGSSVTQIEIEPPHGVKISRILGLSDNLALALANPDIRIEAPIPGKSRIGIEVPNSNPTPVYFRDTWEEFSQIKNTQNILEVPLGRDIKGDIVAMNLIKMPHLLIAGSTGSGKSVSINEILTSVLMMARPDQVQLILVDPKKVELNVYNDIPHLITPVVTDPKKAAGALNQAVIEMDRRYELFKETGSRNINEYNKNKLKSDDAQGFLPYILIVIDELSDLMMVAGAKVESAVIRLAQLARAAGIHMIIATQRPSVDVITGLIKANIPSRIAFAVSSGVDSRTILDANGAEKLIGHGDMLFHPMGASNPIRLQGAYISTDDVESIIKFVKKQGRPKYDNKFDVSIDEIDEVKESHNSQDELFEDALKIVYEKQAASSSMLQRYFKIGYNRAASLIDEMEQEGLIGPKNGSKPREVFLTKIDSYFYQKKSNFSDNNLMKEPKSANENK